MINGSPLLFSQKSGKIWQKNIEIVVNKLMEFQKLLNREKKMKISIVKLLHILNSKILLFVYNTF